ncbi:MULTISPECIES: hypothetical protein [unclassified Beijerinckia]|uniref:hypothetical protein n=1 Tax=unclassified Beijerinckia TaxID=2638183 RepID=UPI00089462A3|nr:MULTISPECIES: hypothetical protein [unclassified Beijerinckia]MDH7796475.1 hypothetical protein [Beijerinckia sp. GAS462]SEC46734.1 hypothetical protein SAMN05443249_2759 [Beijerinckia sp. 28-YEA-48]
MKNDLQALADGLLKKVIAISGTLELIEEGKEELREATARADEPFVFTSELGVVKTKRGSTAAFKGQAPVLNQAVWDALPEQKKKQLLGAGVVSLQDQYSQNRKPSVEITPSTAALKKAA